MGCTPKLCTVNAKLIGGASGLSPTQRYMRFKNRTYFGQGYGCGTLWSHLGALWGQFGAQSAWASYMGRQTVFSLRARELWLQDVPGNIALGDANWPKLKD